MQLVEEALKFQLPASDYPNKVGYVTPGVILLVNSMSEIEYKGRDKFVPKDVTVTVTCKPKLLYPSSATNWANDMYAIRLNFREEHEVCYENENSACIPTTNITESSIKYLIFLRDSLLQFELMTIEGDYSRISLGKIHLEREVLRLQTLSSRIKLFTNELREEKFNVLLSALVRANRLDEKINDLLLCVKSDLKSLTIT